MMAARTGLTQTAVSRIWRAFHLKPHRVDYWKLSTDPHFVDKLYDVVGLYLDPPERALVLCVDEKSQVQALDRSAPVLPMMPADPQRQTHTYNRNGTTSLFAALDMASGRVYSSLHRRHRATEFKKFLAQLDREVPAEHDVHLSLDNYATHKTPDIRRWLARHPRLHPHRTPPSSSWHHRHRATESKHFLAQLHREVPAEHDVHLILDNHATHKTPDIRRWLARHPRFHLHFTPTSSSWLNLVERFFAELTTRLLRR